MGAVIKVDGKQHIEDTAETTQEVRDEAVLDAARAVVSRLSIMATERMRQKLEIERRWLENLRQYYGKYETTIFKNLTESKRSTAFIKLTRHKTNGWAARLSDLLFPTDDRNWGIEPTPVPTLIKKAQEAVEAARAATQEANQQTDPRMAEMMAMQAQGYADQKKKTDADIEEAKKRCAAMQRVIEDQLVESNYAAEARDAIEDGCRIGTGIIKGPLTSNRLRREWREGAGGFFELTQVPDPIPEYKRIDPWHFFPDMSARTIAESESELERSLPTVKDLRKNALKLGFNKDATRRLIKRGPDFLGSDTDHLTHLREIVGEGEAIKDRFVMWEYNGSLECDEVVLLLKAAGQHEDALKLEAEDDPLRDYRVIVYFCQDEVLKIEPYYPLDSGETLYSVWNFEKGETSLFGIGVPEIMSDSQRAANGAWRMTMDNSGLSVGPQIVINKDEITPQDGSYGIKAMKVWLRSGTNLSSGPGNRPFEIFNIPNNQAQLAGIIEMAKMFADEETSMPTIAQGEQGAATQTLGGMSMLFNSANVVFRRVVKSFDDDLTRPTIRRGYDWNMQFNPDETIKGDMQVDARGTSVLLVREIQSANLLNIMQNWTIHPVIGAYIKVREGLEKALQTMMIPPNDVLFDQETADKRLAEAAAANAPAEQVDPAELRLQIAQIEAQNRLEIVSMQREIKLMELASRENMSVGQLKAQLAIKDIETKSKERTFAAGLAVEERRAERAAQAGTDPVDAVGQGVG